MSVLYGYRYTPEGGFEEKLFDVKETEKRYSGKMFDRSVVLKSEIGKVWCPYANEPNAMVFFKEYNRDKAIVLLSAYMMEALCRNQKLCVEFSRATVTILDMGNIPFI